MVHSSGFYLSVLLGNSYNYPGLNVHISLLDLLKGQHSYVPGSVISWRPQKDVS